MTLMADPIHPNALGDRVTAAGWVICRSFAPYTAGDSGGTMTPTSIRAALLPGMGVAQARQTPAAQPKSLRRRGEKDEPLDEDNVDHPDRSAPASGIRHRGGQPARIRQDRAAGRRDPVQLWPVPGEGHAALPRR